MSNLTVKIAMIVLISGGVLTAGAQNAKARAWTPATEFDDPVMAIDFYIARLVDERMAIPIAELVSRFDDEVMVNHLKSKLESSEDRTHRAIVRSMAGIARMSTNEGVRQDVVFTTLVDALGDSKHHDELYGLTSFRDGDFNRDSRIILLAYFEKQLAGKEDYPRTDARIPLMIGRAGMREAIPLLKVLDEIERAASDDGDSTLLERNGLLVLARFGDPAAIEEAIGLVQQIADREKRVSGMRPLGYICQPEALSYLKPYLFSDIVHKPESICLLPVSEADCAAQALGAMLEGFPHQGPLEEKRAWMRAQTSYTFKSGLELASEDVLGGSESGEISEPSRSVKRRPMRSQRALRGR